MADYIIDIWKDGELVQSVAGKWTDDEARRVTIYYLGYYHAERAQLLREPAAGGAAEVVADIYAPEGPAAGITILW